jgi:hypothetical protein
MTWLTTTIENQRAALARQLESPMGNLARRCAEVWPDRGLLDRVLIRSLPDMPFCRLLYAMDLDGIQVSSNIGRQGADLAKHGQDLSARPFLASAVPCRGLLLSDVYVSEVTRRPCVTAVQVVPGKARVQGFVAADFDLRDLLLPEGGVDESTSAWRQLRGDPAIRDTLFFQQRARSPMDEHMDDVIAILEELICDRGVFHGKLHHSSSRATLWLFDDPYRYRVHVLDEIINPSVCLAYPRRPYPGQATVPAEWVRPILERFRQLREVDETVYLRSSSLNVINGMVGLVFSCDGSHYMPAAEFLEKGDDFWFGGAAVSGMVTP